MGQHGMLWLAKASLFVSFIGAATQPQNHTTELNDIGWITQISCTAQIKKNATAREITVDPVKDIALGLKQGELLRCTSTGHLTVQIGGKLKEIKQDWFTVRLISSPDPDILKAIESYGRLGGRDRQISSIFSPAQGSRVRAQWLEFRWLSDSTIKNVSLLLLDSARREIWREGGIDPAIGHFASENARHVLERLKDQNPQREYFFVIANEQHLLAESRFFLLSTAEEQALDRELRKWDTQHPTLFTHIMRAYWFDRYGLCAETAQEYETALLAAPESRSMIAATIRAENCTGNIERIKELETHLSALESDNGSK